MPDTIKFIFAFAITFFFFSLAGFFFKIDREWYNALAKPDWTPPGAVIGIVWLILFGMISVSVALMYVNYGFSEESRVFFTFLIFNYLFNQAFSYFQFDQKNLFVATIDCAAVALTSLILILTALKFYKPSAYLLIPYFLWTAFATYLSYVIYKMNESIE